MIGMCLAVPPTHSSEAQKAETTDVGAIGDAYRLGRWKLVRDYDDEGEPLAAALAAQPVPNLHFVYHDLPLFPDNMDYEKQKKLGRGREL